MKTGECCCHFVRAHSSRCARNVLQSRFCCSLRHRRRRRREGKEGSPNLDERLKYSLCVCVRRSSEVGTAVVVVVVHRMVHSHMIINRQVTPSTRRSSGRPFLPLLFTIEREGEPIELSNDPAASAAELERTDAGGNKGCLFSGFHPRARNKAPIPAFERPWLGNLLLAIGSSPILPESGPATKCARSENKVIFGVIRNSGLLNSLFHFGRRK